MWTAVLRDETLVTALGPALEPLHASLDEAARALAAGWGVRGGRRAMLLAGRRVSRGVTEDRARRARWHRQLLHRKRGGCAGNTSRNEVSPVRVRPGFGSLRQCRVGRPLPLPLPFDAGGESVGRTGLTTGPGREPKEPVWPTA